MKKDASKRFLAWIIALLMVVTYMPSMAYATDDVSADNDAVAEKNAEDETPEVVSESENTDTATDENLEEIEVLDGKLLITNDLGKGSLSSDGVVTVTAPGKPLGTLTANNIAVYNNTDKAATVSFDYKATNYSAFNKTNDNGTFSGVIEAGGYEVFKLTGLKASSNNTAVLTFSNFTFTEVAEESQLTFTYDSKLGSITVSGQSVSSGYTETVTRSSGVEVTAEAAEGADFLGWINAETGKVFSREATYTLKPINDADVEAVFVDADSKGYYLVGDKYLLDDFEEAAAKAVSLSDQTMVLMNDTTLEKGTYTVPAGVTLLIPFDDDNTLYTTKPGATHGEYNIKNPVTAYRTLTLSDGAKLIINGSLSLSAKQNAAQGSARASGAPTGDVSFIDMAEGSSITVNDNAALYAYGYITGNGTVTAKSGSTVYENFQIEDFRGGSVTTDMAETNAKYKVLPISQYYVQNIEVPLNMEKGSVEKVYASVYMSDNIYGTAIEFIGGSDAMFNLTDGNVIKKYDGSKDRLVVQADGDMSLSAITVTVGDQSISSSGFNLPLNSNITVEIKSGEVCIDQDLSLLPGAEIIIDEGATCTVENDAVVYVYGAEQWGDYCVTGKSFFPVSYAPGRTYTRTEKDLADAKVLVNGTLDASGGLLYTTTNEDYDKGGNIYSTKNGVVKVITGYDDYTYQYLQTADEYVAINLLPANLLNEDGSYVQTLDEETGTYTYDNGNWMCSHGVAQESVVKEVTCTEDGITRITCALDAEYAHTYDKIVPATGHDEYKVPANDATCTSDGNDEYWICKTCHKIYGDKELTKELNGIPVKEKLGHDIVNHDAKDPSCGKVGWDAYETCSRCDYSTYNEKEALEHTATPIPEVSATCTEDGVEAYYICLNCGGMFADKDCTVKLEEKPVIPAGHKWKSTDGKEPTCTESVAGAVCEVCGAEKDVVSALGHDMQPATCTSPSKCSRCEYTEGEALGHDMQAATCTSPSKCSRCEHTEGEALGHDEVTHAAKKANCTEAGWDAYVTCSRCDYSTYKENDKLGHSIKKVDFKAATCTEDGNIKHWKCTTCETLFGDSAGDEVISEETVTISATGHPEDKIVTDKAVAATCEETGLTEGSHCSACRDILTAQQEVPALGHDWDEGKVTTKPTTEKEGIKTYTCKNDKTHIRTDKIAKLTENEVTTYDEFIENLAVLEELADDYISENPGKDPLNLIIKYIRTGVDRYNSGSWNIMAGYEDSDFAAYVADREYEYNLAIETADESDEAADEEKMTVTGLKNLQNLILPNGDYVDLGHMFGTMDLTYSKNFKQDNADVGGWSGDIVDLLSLTDFAGTGDAATVDEMADYIRQNYMGKERSELKDAGFIPNVEEDEEENIVEGHYNEGVFSYTDFLGDLDAYYMMKQLQSSEYEAGDLTAIAEAYFTENLTSKQRSAYLISNRLNGETLRTDLRKEVYKAYTGNSAISTLEGTRDWNSSDSELDMLREAACYAFADYICELAGDYFEELENDYFTISSSERTALAPGVTQTVVKAVTADNLNLSYYIATADVTRDDVTVCANYATRPVEKDSDGNYKWDMTRVIDQAQNVQNKYGDPENEDYIPNYNVVAAVNGDGYNMQTGEPSGALLMDGIEYHACNNSGFFGILADGSAVIGTKADYEKLKKEGSLKEAIGNFGATLVKDGKIAVTVNNEYYNDRNPRTAVGITKTGKVVMMVMDGRMGGSSLDSSCGGSAIEVAQVMLDAGCEEAIMLDGGGSSTYVAKEEGSSKLSVVSIPSDGHGDDKSRSVSTSLYVVSTAPSSTEFDHAVIDSEYAYLTSGTTIQMSATAVSATNNIVDMPEGVKWTVSDTSKASINEDGELTAKVNGTVDVNLILGDEIIGTKTISIVIPDNLYFTRKSVNMVYGESIDLPIKAVYKNKAVAINPKDVNFELSEENAGAFDGLEFTAAQTELKNITITATIPGSLLVSAKLTVYLYTEDQARFDFDNATGGDSQLSWNREVSNSVTADNKTYTAVDRNADMETEYRFAIDMSEIEVPEQLAGLTYMLPGADKADASAWTFLCDLAERISQQTEVCAEIKFDEDVVVDESCLEKITLVNDYFTLSSAEFNKDTNTLTVKLNWIKQSKAIDIEMANPLCILGGIRIVSKDGAEWTNSKLNIVNTGNISYTVYMRANALYSFSLKEENQKTYGLIPYTETRAGKEEKGGYFESVYNTFEDSYTLDKSVKSGWVMGDGGFKYYENDTLFTGIHKIAGYYYQFDEETGLNVGKTRYTGEYTDAKGNEYYIKNGEVNTGTDGWIMTNDGEVRYYNPENNGIREKVTKKETKSTCIVDGYCDYTSASGATYRQPYDDAGGHEYETISGKVICSVCGWQQFSLEDCKVTLSKNDWSYTGNAIKPFTHATDPNGNTLNKNSAKSDYNTTYSDNVKVGVATVVVTASKYGKYHDLRQWRGNYSDSKEVYFTIHPDAPTNVTYSVNSKNVATIKWTKSKSADKYVVQYSTNSGKSWSTAKTLTGNSYTYKMNKKKSYMFRVVAKAQGLDKNGKTATYTALTYPVAKIKTVSKLKVSNTASTGKPKVTWTGVKEAGKYMVYRSTTGKSGSYKKVATTTKKYYTDSKATAGKTYYYMIKSVYSKNTKMNSEYSAAVKTVCDLARPSLTLKNSGKSKIKVSWKKVSGASSYNVYRKVSGGKWALVKSTTGKSFTDTKLTKGKTYYYRAIAVKKGNSEANSAYSPTKSMKSK